LEVCYDAERVRTNTLRVRLHTCKVERSEIAVTTRHVPRSSSHMISALYSIGFMLTCGDDTNINKMLIGTV